MVDLLSLKNQSSSLTNQNHHGLVTQMRLTPVAGFHEVEMPKSASSMSARTKFSSARTMRTILAGLSSFVRSAWLS